MHFLYWANANLARKQITERLGAMQGVELTIVDNVADAIAMLPKADAMALYDPQLPQAQQLVAALNSPESRVRWMHILTAGRESLEKAGLPRHVAITYAAGAASPAVAEHAMALMLALCRRLPDALSAAATGKWDRGMVPRASALEGSTLAIIGYGQIGRHLARRAHAFDMRIVTVSRSQQRDEWVADARPMAQLHAVLAEADVVAMTIALTAETRHLMGAAEFAACKRGALLVNVARGGVIDQAALREALVSGQLAGAGLDVTEPEPLPEGDPLWTAPNLLLTPHYAGAGSPRSLERLAEGVADNLQRFMADKPLQHQLPG